MKIIPALIILFISFTFAAAQNEQAPIVEKEFAYKDWTYKNVRTGEEINLRDHTSGKKLVMVVYWAPWCPNWKYDAPMVQRLYDKYKASGFAVIGVGEYDPVYAMKASLDNFKITFPSVYESETREARQTTLHADYRKQAGDTRKWGSPWYIFLQPASLEAKGDVLIRKANVVNGELIEAEAEKFIREKLGLPAAASNASTDGAIEVCEPDKKASGLVKP